KGNSADHRKPARRLQDRNWWQCRRSWEGEQGPGHGISRDDRADAYGDHPPGSIILRDVHGGSYSASRSRWRGSNITSRPSTIWVQCDPRADRISWYPDAQHADPDRSNWDKSGGGT